MSIVTITKNNFDQEVMKSDKPVLIDFWASWCGPCKMLSPIVDEIASETKAVKVGKINVDDERELASAFRVMSIPTLAIIKNGSLVKTMVGFKPKEDILEMIEEA